MMPPKPEPIPDPRAAAVMAVAADLAQRGQALEARSYNRQNERAGAYIEAAHLIREAFQKAD